MGTFFWLMRYCSTTCLKKEYRDLVGSSDVNLALINGLSFSRCFSIVKLNKSTFFVGIGSFKAEISKRKAQLVPANQRLGILA